MVSVSIPRKKSRLDKLMVYLGLKKKTASNLKRSDLIMNRAGKVVNRKRFWSIIPVARMIRKHPQSIPLKYRRHLSRYTTKQKGNVVDFKKQSRANRKQQADLYFALHNIKRKSKSEYYKLAKHVMKKNEVESSKKSKIMKKIRKLLKN